MPLPEDIEEPMLTFHNPSLGPNQSIKINRRWQWWFLVALNIGFLIIGQAVGVLLGRFYYDNGGNSKWLATLVQTVGFPILIVPYLFIDRNQTHSNDSDPSSIIVVSFVYVALGLLFAVDNMLCSIGLLYLSASTYSLVFSTQLAFNAVFSFFINRHKFTVLILNSVVILTLSASLLAFDDDDDGRPDYVVGIVITVLASALFSLSLSLMQLSFQKVIKKETFSAVMEMQIYTAVVSTSVSAMCLFTSGEWKTLGLEMDSFGSGRGWYVVTLVGIAVSWQLCSVGVVGLVFLVSSLYSNVVSTVSLVVTPIASVIVFNDKMNGIKTIALVMAIWGFCSYVYQNYLDDKEATKIEKNVNNSSI